MMIGSGGAYASLSASYLISGALNEEYPMRSAIEIFGCPQQEKSRNTAEPSASIDRFEPFSSLSSGISTLLLHSSALVYKVKLLEPCLSFHKAGGR
jgi:hypothetical protein